MDFLDKFAPVLTGAPHPAVRDQRLLIDCDGPIKIYYAPFEHVNGEARVVLVGITPGPTQMVNANNEARRALQRGKSAAEVKRAAKDTAAFSGEPMRGNLIKQLNHWGVDRWLGLSNSASLFATHRHLVQTTSLLRFPVFVNDDDYRGTPDMTKHPLLRKHLLTYFATEAEQLRDAIFVGLGPKVQVVLTSLARQGVLPESHLIGGMLHPSGNNTYRIAYLTGTRQEPVPHATNPATYDGGRLAFRKAFL